MRNNCKIVQLAGGELDYKTITANQIQEVIDNTRVDNFDIAISFLAKCKNFNDSHVDDILTLTKDYKDNKNIKMLKAISRDDCPAKNKSSCFLFRLTEGTRYVGEAIEYLSQQKDVPEDLIASAIDSSNGFRIDDIVEAIPYNKLLKKEKLYPVMKSLKRKIENIKVREKVKGYILEKKISNGNMESAKYILADFDKVKVKKFDSRKSVFTGHVLS
ncbi:MAG: hypothetical protein N4A43_00070 [Alphaproteobacteria bacterium]|jgi:hypothetical protein|nr:hypothetical protein [Alphaproteobacteria bacterium]